MKKFAAIISLFVLLVSCGGSNEWVHYNTPEFSIDFPHQPKDTSTIGLDVVTVRVFLEPEEAQPDENAYYEVAITKADMDLTPFHDTVFYKTLTAEAKVDALMMSGYVIGDGTKIKCGKYKGMEYKIAMGRTGTGTITLRKIVTPTHIYTLKVITTAARSGNSYINKFLNSLVLKK